MGTDVYLARRLSRLRVTICCGWLCCFLIAPATAQFTTVLNIPPDPNLGSSQSVASNTQVNLSQGGNIGRAFRAGAIDGTSTNVEINIAGGSMANELRSYSATVNISGGTVGQYFSAYLGSLVNISGGTIGGDFRASESIVNFSGGSIGDEFDLFYDSTLHFSGGVIGELFTSSNGSAVTISGGDFRVNGVPVAGLDNVGDTVTPVPYFSDIVSLTGTLADGTPFAFAFQDGDYFASDGTIALQAAAVTPIGPAVTSVPTDPSPSGIRSGQTLLVHPGGVVGNNFNAGWGSVVQIMAGQVGRNFEAVGAQVTIDGGSVGDRFDAFGGSVVHINGGTVGNEFDAFDGSVVQISGGNVGDDFDALPGSMIQITGGAVGDRFEARAGSNVHLSGGSVGDGFLVLRDSVTTISGGEFRVDGVPVTGLEEIGNTVTFDRSFSVLSGTLADGTPVAFSGQDGDSTTYVTLKAAAVPPVGPLLTTLPSDPAPRGIRNGQTLLVQEGGSLGNDFAAGWGSTVQISGGQVGRNFEAINSQVFITGGAVGEHFDAMRGSVVNISGGTVGNYFDAMEGSVVNISGGSVGVGFDALYGSTVNISGGSLGTGFESQPLSTVNISGGTVGAGFDAGAGSTVNISNGSIGNNFEALNVSKVTISGGSIGAGFEAAAGSIVTISGGTIGEDFDALSGSNVNLLGTEFFVGNLDFKSKLTPNVPFKLTSRNYTLSGLLADGTPFSFDLNSTDATGQDFFHSSAHLSITLILPGDFDASGIVDAADYVVWRDRLGSVTTMPGDPTPGLVTQDDYLVWKANFGHAFVGSGAVSGTAVHPHSVPEPIGAVPGGLACLLLPWSLKRRVSR